MSSIALRTPDLQSRLVAGRPHPDRSRTIGVLILDHPSSGSASLLSAIHAAAREADYVVSVVHLPVAGSSPVLAAIERLRQMAVEGVLVIAPRGGATEALTEVSAEFPVVVIGAGPQDKVSTVSVDDYAGAAAATRHLLELGNHTVFHVAGPPGRHDSDLRLAGWRDTLLAAGANAPAPLIGDHSATSGYEAGRQLGLRSDLTAIFVAGDQMALGVLRALDERERRVPEDVSVVGFDGIPQGEFFTPPLTTVRHDVTETGRLGFELLHNEIERGGQARIHHTIRAELIVRATTMAAIRPAASINWPVFSGSES